MLVGPTGGVVWLMLKARREVSSALRPLVGHMEKQAIPALAPELATQAWFNVVDRVTLMGNSPSVSAGWPTIVSLVGSVESMVNIEIVFEPGLTATKFYINELLRLSVILAKTTLTFPATLTAPWLKRESGAAGAPVESTPLIPAPPVAVIDPSERVPSAATLNATTELLAALVMK